ncbi:MAG: DUF6629 family protein [Bacteroidia bacterium]
MCFSPSVSFIASGVLLTAGIASLKQVRERSQIPLACIPLIFSAQQFCEGMIWISFPGRQNTSTIFMYAFLVFAQVIWPFWVPLSVFTVERVEKRRKLLKVILGIGVLLSLFLLISLLIFPAGMSISEHHIHYELGRRASIISLFYLVVTVVPLFISGSKGMNRVGAVVLISMIATYIFFRGHFISVWCLFAAVISFMIFFVVKDKNSSIPDGSV